MLLHRTLVMTPCLCIGLLLAVNAASAAGVYLRPVGDSNSRLEIKEAVINGDNTTILFWTWPDRGDADFKKPCSVNFYTVTVGPGLSAASPKPAAKGVCTGATLAHAGLLDSGAVRLVSMDRLEEWRDGEQVSSKTFASMKDVGTLRVSAADMGSQFIDFSPAGDLVMAVLVNGYAASDWPGLSAVVVGLRADNAKRWLLKFNDSDEAFMLEALWAATGGGALLNMATIDKSAMVPDPETQLLFVTAQGKSSKITLMEVAKPFDYASIQSGSADAMQRFAEYQQNNQSESIDKLIARTSKGGGFDVLFQRKSTAAAREGAFLLRLGADGSTLAEVNFGSLMKDHGLERWFDFYLSGDELVLLSHNTVTQQGGSSKRKAWGQTIVSRVKLATQSVDARLVPLDRQYLEAAMNAGDEGQQYLEARPGSDPVLLTSVGGIPLAVGQRYAKKGAQLHLQEATQELDAYTEGYDKHQAAIAKVEKASRRKAERQARQERLSKDMESATGMSQEEFNALSDRKQAEIMMQDGNLEAMMAALMQQGSSMQGNMTPEQQARMQAQMAQVQQMMQGGAAGMPAGTTAGPARQASPQAANLAASFTVDSLQRGHIEYRGSGPVTLTLIDRKSGDELLKKDFPAGVIDEYISLGRYQLPADQVGVLIKGGGGELLEDLVPAAGS